MAQGPVSSVLVTIQITVRILESEVQKSGFTGLSNYQQILMKFYGELGCG